MKWKSIHSRDIVKLQQKFCRRHNWNRRVNEPILVARDDHVSPVILGTNTLHRIFKIAICSCKSRFDFRSARIKHIKNRSKRKHLISQHLASELVSQYVHDITC